jgi:hypothetical protein
MEETNNINKREKVKKTLAELSQEGWESTHTSFGNRIIYKNGNNRILYNTKEQTIEKRYTI